MGDEAGSAFLNAQDREWLSMKERVSEVIERRRMMPVTKSTMEAVLGEIGNTMIRSTGLVGVEIAVTVKARA